MSEHMPASPSSETATEADGTLRESDAEDFRQRLASLKRCIPHMVDNGGIWPRDVEWLIAELEKSRASLVSSPVPAEAPSEDTALCVHCGDLRHKHFGRGEFCDPLMRFGDRRWYPSSARSTPTEATHG